MEELCVSQWDECNRLWLGSTLPGKYLTKMQAQVLKEILIHGERAAANELGISRGTVSTHIKNIKAKFECRTIIELRKMVIIAGLGQTLFIKALK